MRIFLEKKNEMKSLIVDQSWNFAGNLFSHFFNTSGTYSHHDHSFTKEHKFQAEEISY